MRIKLALVSLLATLSLAAPAALAGIYIEPFLGYQFGTYDGGTSENDVAGTSLGARLGFQTLGFALGVEYSTGTVKVDTNPETEFDLTDMGVFVSYEFPILFRVYATYIFDSKADGASEILGDGMRLGVGYTGLPFVVINVEQVTRSYDETDTGASIDREVSATMVSISLPLP